MNTRMTVGRKHRLCAGARVLRIYVAFVASIALQAVRAETMVDGLPRAVRWSPARYGIWRAHRRYIR